MCPVLKMKLQRLCLYFRLWKFASLAMKHTTIKHLFHRYQTFSGQRSEHVMGLFHLWEPKSIYKRDIISYVKFLLLSERLLTKFIAYCNELKHLKHLTIQLKLSGILFQLAETDWCQSLNEIWRKTWRLKSVFNRLNRKQGPIVKVPYYLLLGQFLPFWGFYNVENLLFSINLNNFKFETKMGHYRTFSLVLKWCTNHRKLYFIRLKKCKTYPFRQGITFPLFCTGHMVCPVRALSSYCKLRQSISRLLQTASNHFNFLLYNLITIWNFTKLSANLIVLKCRFFRILNSWNWMKFLYIYITKYQIKAYHQK